jgi:hypothetical protein
MRWPQFTLRRLFAAVTLIGIGIPVLIDGSRREMQNPRSNAEDDVARCVMGLGSSLIASGTCLLFARLRYAALVGILALGFPFALLVVLVWGAIIFNAVWYGLTGIRLL